MSTTVVLDDRLQTLVDPAATAEKIAADNQLTVRDTARAAWRENIRGRPRSSRRSRRS